MKNATVKLFGLLALSAAGAFGQATISFNFPNEPTINVTYTAGGLASLTSYLGSGAALTTLASSAGSADTVINLTSLSPSTLATGSGLIIDSETMNVVSVSSNAVTVQRGTCGTTATTHASGAAVKRIPFGTFGGMIRYQLVNGFPNAWEIQEIITPVTQPVNPVQ